MSAWTLDVTYIWETASLLSSVPVESLILCCFISIPVPNRPSSFLLVYQQLPYNRSELRMWRDDFHIFNIFIFTYFQRQCFRKCGDHFLSNFSCINLFRRIILMLSRAFFSQPEKPTKQGLLFWNIDRACVFQFV